MERNPFEVILSEEFLLLQEESLDFYMLGLQRINQMSWEFNPWWHRVPNYLLCLLSRKQKNVWYESDPEVYTGPERRHNIRDMWQTCRRQVIMRMMPKTEKIEQLKDVI